MTLPAVASPGAAHAADRAPTTARAQVVGLSARYVNKLSLLKKNALYT